MGKYYYLVWLFVLILLFGFFSIPKIFDRISSGSIVEDNRSVPAKPLSYLNIDNEPKKVPEFLMFNQDSLLIGNEDFLGKVYIVEFFFTSCPSICPIMNKNMKIIDDFFYDRYDFGIASFTIDPITDTPKRLKEYSERLEVKSKNWHFLTGKVDNIYELSNSGFNIFAGVNPAVAGGFEHQGFFALIDKNGFIRSRRDINGNPIVYYLGITSVGSDIQGIDMIKEDIKKLLENG